ncbi:MAG: calcium/sodium antiporter [Rhodobacteraceae bacterium]|nr:calcium/sodium antiporter [Paracoccaceae bacterium]
MLYLAFAAGLVALFFGGDWLVRGAVGVARRFRVPPMVIGLTIVGFGTSMPELLVSVEAALDGVPQIAIGNVIGSNIANVLLILGAAAVIFPVHAPLAPMRRDIIAVILATLALWAVLASGEIGRGIGAAMVLALAVYLFYCLRAGDAAEPEDELPLPLWRALAEGIGGLLVLMAGARLLVWSASEIARTYGVSEAVIGLTVVAIGTSLPELATAVVAAYRKQSEIALGNVLGSNLFNILAILGITALVVPIPVDPRFAGLDIALALAAVLVLPALSAVAGRIGRIAGGAMLAAYAAYIVLMGVS